LERKSATIEGMVWLGIAWMGLGIQNPPTLLIGKPEGPLTPPRLCPKYRWEFPFRIPVYESGDGESRELRFEVFCQTVKRLPEAEAVSRALTRLYELLKVRLKGEHPRSYQQRIVVFLAEGGTAGAEQGVFEGPDSQGTLVLHNTLYIYHLESFANPVEKLREVAHEYGHAVLPPVGGFEKPESWANGLLGETLFLFWAEQELRAGRWKPEELFDVDPSALSEWVRKWALPLSDSVWLKGVNEHVLAGKGEQAMREYVGLALYLAEAFPEALPRALRVGGGTRAVDVLNGLFLALEERSEWKVLLPERHKGKPLWLPLPSGGEWRGGRVLKRSGKWVQVQPSSSGLVLHVPIKMLWKE
jgi:hypothetical protein